MANESGQNFSNHAQMVPGYHYVTSPLSLIYVVWSIARLVRDPGAETAYSLVGALALFGAVAYARLSALRAQDRTIRLEERLRYTRILPADLQSRIEEIRPSHLIALRFSSDAEAPELVRKVLANPEMKPKEIKQSIKQWRADYLRV
jgi:Family of unknown function (DUF6526)